jgi:hypothetical protein
MSILVMWPVFTFNLVGCVDKTRIFHYDFIATKMYTSVRYDEGMEKKLTESD